MTPKDKTAKSEQPQELTEEQRLEKIIDFILDIGENGCPPDADCADYETKKGDIRQVDCDWCIRSELKKLLRRLGCLFPQEVKDAVAKARREESRKVSKQYQKLIQETILPNAEKRWWGNLRRDNECVIVEKRLIPKEGELVEAYLTERECIVVGFPDENDEEHNCDEMGCGTFSHVIYRFPLKPSEDTEGGKG